MVSGGVEFRIGTASWTDPSLVNSDLFDSEARLRLHAQRLNGIEVDSTYRAFGDACRG